MEFAKLHCGNKECQKVLGFIPADNMPKESPEVYCEQCAEQLKKESEEKWQK